MKELLYIEASPRKSRSASIEVAQGFIEQIRLRHAGVHVHTLDLWASDLPDLSHEMMEAKYAGIAGHERTPGQSAAWDTLRRLAAPLHTAEHILLAVPLWNFGIPYRLKQFIDLVTHKDLLFRFDEAGLTGLLKGPRATLICARGLDYAVPDGASAHAMDFQRPYLEAWLRFIGVSEVRTVVVEKTLLGAQEDARARVVAKQHAIELARLA